MFPPFARDAQLREMNEKSNTLPGQSRIPLDRELGAFLRRDLQTPRLNKMAPWLWLTTSQDNSNISTMTELRIKGRFVVITEDPELHLVWYYDRVFIKPLPKYLLSYDFWKDYLHPQQGGTPATDYDATRKAATGFIRSYSHLIKHKSDFRMAKSENDPTLRLIPKRIKYTDFCKFINCFADIPDSDCSIRWQYGELRLTRLNAWARLLLGESTFMSIRRQYAQIIARAYAPLAFVFAFLSVSLSAMQVGIGVLQSQPGRRAPSLVDTSWVFSILALALLAGSVLLIFVHVAWLGLDEFVFAVKQRLRIRRERKLRASAQKAP